jgi:hypothetical protein
MATVIRPVVSTKNKYYIDKHRHYELKHFCLQYPTWKKLHDEALESCITAAKLERESSTNIPSDITAKYGIRRARYAEYIKLVEDTAKKADEDLWYYILRAVTEGLSFPYLKTVMEIPCGKDMYYDRYRKFFWLLSAMRD